MKPDTRYMTKLHKAYCKAVAIGEGSWGVITQRMSDKGVRKPDGTELTSTYLIYVIRKYGEGFDFARPDVRVMKNSLFLRRLHTAFRKVVDRHNPQTMDEICERMTKNGYRNTKGGVMTRTNMDRAIRKHGHKLDFSWYANSSYQRKRYWVARVDKKFKGKNLSEYKTKKALSKRLGIDPIPPEAFERIVSLGWVCHTERMDKVLPNLLKNLMREHGYIPVEKLGDLLHDLRIKNVSDRAFDNGWTTHRFLADLNIDRHAIYREVVLEVLDGIRHEPLHIIANKLNERNLLIGNDMVEDVYPTSKIDNRKWSESHVRMVLG